MNNPFENLFGGVKNDPKILEKYGRNLTDLSIKGKLDPVIGREEEIRRIIRILSRRTKNNPVLIGEPGVGKTAIIEGLAYKIVTGDVPEILKDKEIYELNISQLIAGAKFQGEFEERINAIINKIKETNGNTIIFIDEVHTLVGTGRNSESSMDAANIFKPILARGEIRLIGATTISEYKKYIEKDPALERRMQKIDISEPTIEDTITILRGLKEKYESYHGVRIHDNAIISAANLSSRYIQDRNLPDKAIDLVDEASALIRTELESIPEELEKNQKNLKQLLIEKKALEKESDLKSINRLKEVNKKITELEPEIEQQTKIWNSEIETMKELNQLRNEKQKLESDLINAEVNDLEKASVIKYRDLPEINQKIEKWKKKNSDNSKRFLHEEVNEDTIAQIVSKWTGVPVKNLVESELKKLQQLDVDLKKYIKGQDKAVESVSNVIKKSRIGINDPNKPIGTFMFLGSTGVGKTELSKRLAQLMFDSEKSLIRFDMSEFAEAQSIAKLIGSPPGYVGYEEGGRLTDVVRRKPYSIILFDEIEKAHSSIFNLLLQIMDDGRLTDSKGIEVNFKNTIIIMTSNIASEKIIENDSLNNKELISELLKVFRPEFINRIDELIIFNPLTKEAINEIVKNELLYFSQTLKQKDYLFIFDDVVVEKIALNGFDNLFGARPIKRYISKNLENLITNEIIEGKVKQLKQYKITIENDQFVVKERTLN